MGKPPERETPNARWTILNIFIFIKWALLAFNGNDIQNNQSM